MITCYFEDKNKARGGLRHVTVNALIINKGKILMGKRGSVGGKKMKEFGKWGLIGGYVSRDETLSQALKREAREETGCEIENLVLFWINDNPYRRKDDVQNVDFIFIADFVKQLQNKCEEVTQLEWFSLDALPLPEDIAFDFGECIARYKEYLKNNFSLPILSRT